MYTKIANLKKIIFIFCLAFSTLILVELVLQVYNPFSFRQKGEAIVLPRNRKMIFSNNRIPVLPRTVVHTKNSLGFRGPEMPSDFHNYISFFAVGGSTTECFYLTDSLCWTTLLTNRLKKGNPNIWLNNAGFQGHSTFGHDILINSYLKYLQPDYLLLMVGINEMNRTDIMEDESVSRKSTKNSLWGWLKRRSETVSLVLNIQRHVMADRLSVSDSYVNLKNSHDTLLLSPQAIDSAVHAQHPLYLAYQHRLNKILDTCISYNITPILITQPLLFGEGFDVNTRANLETYKINNTANGQLIWKLLEGYNDITRKAGRERSIKVIDLAREMPKNSLFFYDICHFSNEGAKEVSDILFKHLEKMLLYRNPGPADTVKP